MILSELTVFQNDNFEVQTFAVGVCYANDNEFDEYYIVINKGTGVVEYKTPGVVDAIVYAYNTDHMLKNKPWEWAEQARKNLDIGKVVPAEEMN